MRLHSIYGVILLGLTGIMACNSTAVVDQNVSLKNAKWERQNKAVFPFEISDTLSSYAVYLNLRHAGDYPYKNLYLFVKTISPTGLIAKDTAQMILADNKGRWLGKGIGDIYDYQFKFKERVRFPEIGTYGLEIEHAMRELVIEDITDIGVRIEMEKN